MNAIGLIEVIGYVAAIEASDACVKSTNVNLVGIDKVGSGIVTLTITGDVGAVKSAVEAGEIAAEKIGILRSTHVIPRPHKEVSDTIFKKETKKEIKAEIETTIADETLTEISEKININENSEDFNEELSEEILEELQIEVKEDVVAEDQNDKLDNTEVLIKKDINNKEDLSKMSMKDLKVLAKELDSSMANRKLNALKKEELINLVDKLIRKDR